MSDVTNPRGWMERLDSAANEMGIDLDESQLDVLWRYGVMLRERNEHVNLTSVTSPEGILTVHMLDSLTLVPHLGDAVRIIDVGTGGGFPGIPLAVACPQRHFTLIDGTQKKIRFVAEGIKRSTSATRPRSPRAPKVTRAKKTSTWWCCARSECWPTYYITRCHCSPRPGVCSR